MKAARVRLDFYTIDGVSPPPQFRHGTRREGNIFQPSAPVVLLRPTTHKPFGSTDLTLYRPTSTPMLQKPIHLQTFISSPGFETRSYGTAVSVTNHHTGWAARI
ncbi:hypothetical protein TNCV_1228141 [Trichonephila clavipes]|nr:hypothetical protein TNCV_1228141 [Trichonephila clavipes]